MSYLDIPRLGGRIHFGYGEAGSLTVPYDFHNGDLAGNTSSAELSVPPNFSNLTMVIKRPTTSYGNVVILESRAISTGPWSQVFPSIAILLMISIKRIFIRPMYFRLADQQ